MGIEGSKVVNTSTFYSLKTFKTFRNEIKYGKVKLYSYPITSPNMKKDNITTLVFKRQRKVF